MADISSYTFNYQEVATALVKQQELHEGIWQLAFEFGFTASLMGPDPTDLKPTVIIPLSKVMLIKAEKENNLTVDAAKVNPMKK